jgi:CheY-like chemotaxis protein
MPHKLLLADDSVTIQRVIELTFADEDVQVRAVGDGDKAIASIQLERPDIVLADVGMPQRDGYDVAAFIKGNPQLASIPVLLLTGAFEPIDETRARAVGCDGVLVKPFEPQMVINRVKDLLAGRRSGGLWGAKPASPESPVEAPRPMVPLENEPSEQPAQSGGGAATSASLEEYFDRLDAAFASVEAATEARSAANVPHATPTTQPSPVSASVSPMSTTGSAAGLSTDDLPGWDPDLMGDPHRTAAASAPAEPAPAPPAPVHAAPTIPLSTFSTLPTAPPASEPAAASSLPLQDWSGPPEPAAVAPSPEPAVVTPPESMPVAPPPVVAPSPRQPVFETPIAAGPSAPIVERVAPAPAPAPTPAAATPVSVTVPSLAEAFAALLSAEQGRRVAMSTVGPSTVSEDTMEEIVRQVVARMTDQVVRDTVIDVAERLVRQEIERIKAQ